MQHLTLSPAHFSTRSARFGQRSSIRAERPDIDASSSPIALPLLVVRSPPGPLPFGSPSPVPLHQRALIILFCRRGLREFAPSPRGCPQAQPRHPLARDEAPHIRRIPPRRQPPLLDGQQPEPACCPQSVAYR